jgi:Flp pilus assembly protein TadD
MQANARALELDPFSLNLNAHRAGLLSYAHRYDASIAQARKTLALDPDFPLAHANLAVAELGKGNHEAAIAELRKAVELSQGDAGYKAVLAHACARAGRTDEARRLLAEITTHAATEGASGSQLLLVDIAGVHAGLGAKEEALRWLEKAYAERDNALLQLLTDYRFHSLRSEPRFQSLVRRVGLSPANPVE